MTKKEQYRKLRNLFFQMVEEHYPNTTIDSDGGGRWQLILENDMEFELSNINYGGGILGFTLRGDKGYRKSKEIEDDLNELWTSVWNNFYDEVEN